MADVVSQGAYPSIEDIANRARAFVNDAYQGGAGRILTDAAPFTTEYINAAFEELQDRLRNNGVITLTRDNVILTPILPAVPPNNPQVQVFVSYTGFFDGTTMHKVPVLPSDLRSLLKVWEAPTGATSAFQPMTQCMEGLPSCLPGLWLGQWEYREDKLVMIGSTQSEDLRIRYQTQMAKITANSNENDWSDISVNILASVNSLATLVAKYYARARGSAGLPQIDADAEKQIKLILRTYTRRAQSIRYYRQPYQPPDGTQTWGTALPF